MGPSDTALQPGLQYKDTQMTGFLALMTILFSSHHLDISRRSLFRFSSTASLVFPVAVIVESSAYISTDALTFRAGADPAFG